MTSPTGSHENLELERSRFGESPNASKLRKILQMHRPQILFLCETKLRSRQTHKECRRLNFDNNFAVGRNGMSGGITLCWKTDVQLKVIFIVAIT